LSGGNPLAGALGAAGAAPGPARKAIPSSIVKGATTGIGTPGAGLPLGEQLKAFRKPENIAQVATGLTGVGGTKEQAIQGLGAFGAGIQRRGEAEKTRKFALDKEKRDVARERGKETRGAERKVAAAETKREFDAGQQKERLESQKERDVAKAKAKEDFTPSNAVAVWNTSMRALFDTDKSLDNTFKVLGKMYPNTRFKKEDIKKIIDDSPEAIKEGDGLFKKLTDMFKKKKDETVGPNIYIDPETGEEHSRKEGKVLVKRNGKIGNVEKEEVLETDEVL